MANIPAGVTIDDITEAYNSVKDVNFQCTEDLAGRGPKFLKAREVLTKMFEWAFFNGDDDAGEILDAYRYFGWAWDDCDVVYNGKTYHFTEDDTYAFDIDEVYFFQNKIEEQGVGFTISDLADFYQWGHISHFYW